MPAPGPGGEDALTRRRAERGFALLIVLWSVVLLTSIVTGMTVSGRTELQLAANLRAEAEAEAVADGAVYEAAYHLLNRNPGWVADGRPISAGSPEVAVRLCVVNEGGKVNPNIASPGLMQSLLEAVGADPTRSGRLAAAIYDWRTVGEVPSPGGAKLPQYRAAGLSYGPPSAPFATLDELGLVLGMTPDLLRRLVPYLTVLTAEDPDPGIASPVVLTALHALIGFDVRSFAAAAPPKTVMVTAAAQTRSGARFIRRAAMRLRTRNDEPLLRMLAWEEADDAPSCR